MSKIRLHELAKELGLENKAIIDICEELGISGKKSHSNTMTDDEADRVRRHVIRSAVSANTTPVVREVKHEDQLLTEQRVGNLIRRRKKADSPDTPVTTDTPPQKTIDLSDIPEANSFKSLTPNLEEERNQRSEALAKANALFSGLPSREEPEAIVESPSEQHLPQTISSEEQVSEIVVEVAPEEVEEPALTVIEEPVLEVAPEVEELKVDSEIPAEQVLAETVVAEQAQEQVVDLDDMRRRHDVRAPKILGKIELKAKPDPVSINKASQEKSRKQVPTKVAIVEDDSHSNRKKKKQVLRRDELIDYEGDKEFWKTKKDKSGKRGKHSQNFGGQDADALSKAVKRSVRVETFISVGEISKQMGVKVGEVITKLMNLGMMATINQLIDYETAEILANEFGATILNVSYDVEDEIKKLLEPDNEEDLILRPPVVTVMGHVDHGKTSLLDAIRKTSVTKGEFGGITQHIGAYNVRVPSGGSVTFLDTPGHQAFTAMRSRGASVTDIVVLVVAADDGVMPQTIEAINHAKAAKVPIILAINKVDKEGANIDKIMNQIAEYGLVPEDWGGETIVVPVSAHTKFNLDLLLENLHLQSEILELKANPNRSAVGTVIESKLDKGRGPVATVLVRNGTLKKGDIFVSGSVSGKVRALVSDSGEPILSAGPGIPVEVLGASETPKAGDDFLILSSEGKAREIAEQRAAKDRLKELAQKGTNSSGAGMTLERFSEMVEAGGLKELPLVVKADVQGSLEAVCNSLEQIKNEEVKINIIHRGVGAISENDVQLATASKAVVVGFNVRADNRAAQIIQDEGIEAIYSRVIYDLLDLVGKALKGMLAPKFKESTLGRVEVRDTFKVPKLGLIAGSYVLDGSIERGSLVRLLRDNKVIFEGKMASLRRFKDDVKEVQAGYECGIGIDGYNDIKNGDVIEVYKLVQTEV